MQKKQAGNYFDSFINLNIDYDKETKDFKQLMVIEVDILSIYL